MFLMISLCWWNACLNFFSCVNLLLKTQYEPIIFLQFSHCSFFTIDQSVWKKSRFFYSSCCQSGFEHREFSQFGIIYAVPSYKEVRVLDIELPIVKSTCLILDFTKKIVERSSKDLVKKLKQFTKLSTASMKN